MNDCKQTGVIFNIQKFSVHDGAGIRTIVFVKGCPLRCLWCSNPESQRLEPERAYNHSRCLGAPACGLCAEACPSGALSVRDGLVCDDRSRCTECFACTRVCPSGAQTLYGETVTVNAVLQKADDDAVFYARSGGGITVSGGEPLAQPEFTLALLREAKARHIHTAVETCGHYSTALLDALCRTARSLIYDIKTLSAEKHKRFAGIGNERILKNFNHICAKYPDLPLLVRTPVVPGFNDSEEEILAIRDRIPARENVRYELLPYHRMGQPKYAYLGRTYAMEGVTADEARVSRLNDLIAR